MRKRWRRSGSALVAVVLLLLLAIAVVPPAFAAHGASGSQAFTWRYAGATGQATMRDVVPAPDGALYAVGSTSSNGGSDADVLVARFEGGRTPVWTKTWDNGVGGAYSWAATTDRSSNIVVVGMTATQSAGDDWVVLKYSPSGELLWKATLGGDYASADYVNAVACDRRGNVLAAGSLLDAQDNHCFAVVKFGAADGHVVWKYVEDGLDPAWHDDKAQDVVVDAAGNAYATGVSYNADHTLHRCLTVKLTASGGVAWRKLIAPKGLDRYGYYLARVGTSLYVQMYGNQSAEKAPLLLAKYTTAGARSWVRAVSLKGVSQVYPYAVAANKTGLAVVADADEGSGVIAKLTPAGKLAWAHVYRRSETRVSRTFHSLCMDADGRVWAAGQALIPGVPYPQGDWLLQKFRATGRTVWAKTLGGLEGGYDELESVVLTGTSGLWVAGDIAHADNAVKDPAVGKYRR